MSSSALAFLATQHIPSSSISSVAASSFLSDPAPKNPLASLYPIIEPGGSDSAAFDNVLELMLMNGHELPEAVMMMIPEAWQDHPEMDIDKRAFYEWAACLMVRL